MQLWWRKKGGVNIENHEERVSTGIISLAKTDKQQQQNIEITSFMLFVLVSTSRHDGFSFFHFFFYYRHSAAAISGFWGIFFYCCCFCSIVL